MKILFLHNFYQQPGGEDQAFQREKTLLESRGQSVITYTVHNDEINSLSSLGIAARTFWNPDTYRAVSKMLQEQAVDLLHCHNTFPLISPSVYTAAFEAGVPVVQTLHNFRLICPNALLLRDGRKCEDCLQTLVPWPGVAHACYRGSRSASAVVAGLITSNRIRGVWNRRGMRLIALTEFARKKLIQGKVPAERISVKPNFLDPDPGFTAEAGHYALFAGRLSEEKGVGLLLSAWKDAGIEAPLVIAGDGPLREQVEAEVRGMAAVEYVGRKAPEDVLNLCRNAAVLIQPSLSYEGLPQTLIEAYAVGTPVVAPRHGAFPQLVKEGESGFLFAAGDAADLAGCIRSAFSDRAKLEKMRLAARTEYETKYTADRNYEMLMGVYAKALSE